MLIAMTRELSPRMGECELTYLGRVQIDIDLARRQHRAYEDALRQLGCRVLPVTPEPELPDSVFVEDPAVVFDEIAVITRPGAESRRPESKTIASALRPYRDLAPIQPPGTLDGGDVLRIGRRVYVGSSQRTNRSGIDQLAAILTPFGYQTAAVPVGACLHLKSAVTQIAPDTLLIDRRWVDPARFDGMDLVDVDEREPMGANALLVGGQVIYSSAYPRTRERMQARGISVTSIEISEMEKAEGALTCCSLIFESEQGRHEAH